MPGGRSIKKQFNARLSDEGFALMQYLQSHYGISQGAVLEILLREKADGMNLKLQRSPGGYRVVQSTNSGSSR